MLPLVEVLMPQAKTESAGCAIALVVIGLLILIPSGLCTTLVASASSWNGFGLALSIGGPFILFGGGLMLFGIWRLRKMDKGPPDEPRSPPWSTRANHGAEL